MVIEKRHKARSYSTTMEMVAFYFVAMPMKRAF